MAVPKRRQSKTRTRKRRTHDSIDATSTTTCKECGANIKPHCVCPKCGYYKGRRIVTIKVKDKKKDDK